MTGEQSKDRSGLSTRGAVLVTIGIVVILGAAVSVVAFWPEIQLQYHRHRFRRGTEAQQVTALTWFLDHRLKTGMTKQEIEVILGEPLERRFGVDSVQSEPLHKVYWFPGRVDPRSPPSLVGLVFHDGKFVGRGSGYSVMYR